MKLHVSINESNPKPPLNTSSLMVGNTHREVSFGARLVVSTQMAAPLKDARFSREEHHIHSSPPILPSISARSTRSLYTLFEFQKTRIDAAAVAIKSIGGNTAVLENLSLQLKSPQLKPDRPATGNELKFASQLDRNLKGLIANQLRISGFSSKEAMREAKVVFRHACQDVLNTRKWERVETTFKHNDQMYSCTLVPASQMKLSKEDIFPVSYHGLGVCSSSTTETTHAANLWTSEIRTLSEEGHELTLFKGIRHGILSPYGLNKGSSERKAGAISRAREVVTAALFSRSDLLKLALAGEEVPLRLVSTSLVTGGLWKERDMLNDQIEAWQDLSQEQPLVLSLIGEDGISHDVKIKLEVAAFNFGVNELALKFHMGHRQSDEYNRVALQRLLGNEQGIDSKAGGWVGEYLARVPKPDNADRVEALASQLIDIWLDKSHHHDGGEPYKAAQRVAMLAFEIGSVPCWNCKSGKDRTGMLDAELKREAVTVHLQNKLSIPGRQLTHDGQQLLQQILLHGGNSEVQSYNTGAPGNKVMHNLPAMNLSYHARVGNDDIWMQTQGLSNLVKS